MKLLTSLTLAIVLVVPLLAQTPAPSAVEAQAKQELNEAARAYRDGNFAEAQAHSEKALQLDPQNKIAPQFVARTIEFERANECANRALEMADMAITLMPENESAWSYKTNILFGAGKIGGNVGRVTTKERALPAIRGSS